VTDVSSSTAAPPKEKARPASPVAVSRLEARGLQKAYGSRKVVKDVSLAVFKGEVVGLLGPNGAGKTTSFYMLVGLLRTDAGQILLDGQAIEDLPIHRRARWPPTRASSCSTSPSPASTRSR
jgi:lipopolysaccharide export system ATP-binding protein